MSSSGSKSKAIPLRTTPSKVIKFPRDRVPKKRTRSSSKSIDGGGDGYETSGLLESAKRIGRSSSDVSIIENRSESLSGVGVKGKGKVEAAPKGKRKRDGDDTEGNSSRRPPPVSRKSLLPSTGHRENTPSSLLRALSKAKGLPAPTPPEGVGADSSTDGKDDRARRLSNLSARISLIGEESLGTTLDSVDESLEKEEDTEQEEILIEQVIEMVEEEEEEEPTQDEVPRAGMDISINDDPNLSHSHSHLHLGIGDESSHHHGDLSSRGDISLAEASALIEKNDSLNRSSLSPMHHPNPNSRSNESILTRFRASQNPFLSLPGLRPPPRQSEVGMDSMEIPIDEEIELSGTEVGREVAGSKAAMSGGRVSGFSGITGDAESSLALSSHLAALSRASGIGISSYLQDGQDDDDHLAELDSVVQQQAAPGQASEDDPDDDPDRTGTTIGGGVGEEGEEEEHSGRIGDEEGDEQEMENSERTIENSGDQSQSRDEDTIARHSEMQEQEQEESGVIETGLLGGNHTLGGDVEAFEDDEGEEEAGDGEGEETSRRTSLSKNGLAKKKKKASSAGKKKKPNQRYHPSLGHPIPSLDKSFITTHFLHFLGPELKLDKQAMEEVIDASHEFLADMMDDAAGYAEHAGRKRMVREEDFEAMMYRMRILTPTLDIQTLSRQLGMSKEEQSAIDQYVLEKRKKKEEKDLKRDMKKKTKGGGVGDVEEEEEAEAEEFEFEDDDKEGEED